MEYEVYIHLFIMKVMRVGIDFTEYGIDNW